MLLRRRRRRRRFRKFPLHRHGVTSRPCTRASGLLNKLTFWESRNFSDKSPHVRHLWLSSRDLADGTGRSGVQLLPWQPEFQRSSNAPCGMEWFQLCHVGISENDPRTSVLVMLRTHTNTLSAPETPLPPGPGSPPCSGDKPDNGLQCKHFLGPINAAQHQHQGLYSWHKTLLYPPPPLPTPPPPHPTPPPHTHTPPPLFLSPRSSSFSPSCVTLPLVCLR